MSWLRACRMVCRTMVPSPLRAKIDKKVFGTQERRRYEWIASWGQVFASVNGSSYSISSTLSLIHDLPEIQQGYSPWTQNWERLSEYQLVSSISERFTRHFCLWPIRCILKKKSEKVSHRVWRLLSWLESRDATSLYLFQVLCSITVVNTCGLHAWRDWDWTVLRWIIWWDFHKRRQLSQLPKRCTTLWTCITGTTQIATMAMAMPPVYRSSSLTSKVNKMLSRAGSPKLGRKLKTQKSKEDKGKNEVCFIWGCESTFIWGVVLCTCNTLSQWNVPTWTFLCFVHDCFRLFVGDETPRSVSKVLNLGVSNIVTLWEFRLDNWAASHLHGADESMKGNKLSTDRSVSCVLVWTESREDSRSEMDYLHVNRTHWLGDFLRRTMEAVRPGPCPWFHCSTSTVTSKFFATSWER